MTTKVAVTSFDDDYSEPLREALELIGGVKDINSQNRNLLVKVGVFHPRSPHHSSLNLVESIINNFENAPEVFIAESDNYCGQAMARLQIYKNLFSERVIPFSLSADVNTKKKNIAGEEMNLSHVLFKPNVFVSTHVMRTFQRGSILKNLFGCTPMVKKSRFHKSEIFCKLLADIYEAIGGIDLAVADGTHLFHSGTEISVRTNTLIASRDAAAAETVAATLAGLKTERMGFLQEFVKRGLGEGNIKNIEIVGTQPEELEKKFKSFRKELRKRFNNRPRPPSISDTIDKLIEEGWMNKPKRIPEVVDELKKRGVANATRSIVGNTLRRRTITTPEHIRTLDRTKIDSEIAYRRMK